MTMSALSAQQYSDDSHSATARAAGAPAIAPELRSSLNRARLALMSLGQLDLNGYKPSLKLIRFGTPKSELESNIDTMFAWLAHGLRIANGISDRALQEEILARVRQYEGQELYLAYHFCQHNTLSLPDHTISPTLQNWLLATIQDAIFSVDTAVDLLRLSKIIQRFGIHIEYNQPFDKTRRPPIFFSLDYIQDILGALWARSPSVDAQVAPTDKIELDGLYAVRQMLQRYSRLCGVGVNPFLIDAKNEWGGWIYCYLSDNEQVHELWASATLTPFPQLIHFMRMVLLGELPARFEWDEEGLIKTFVAEPDPDPAYFQFQLLGDVEGSNTRQLLMSARYRRFEFVHGIYAGLKNVCNLKPYWHLPDAKIGGVKRMLERQAHTAFP